MAAAQEQMGTPGTPGTLEEMVRQGMDLAASVAEEALREIARRDAAEAALRQCKEKYSAAVTDMKGLKGLNGQLAADVEKEKDLRARLTAQVAKEKSANAQLAADVKEMKGLNARLTADCAALRAENDELRRANEELTRKVAEHGAQAKRRKVEPDEPQPEPVSRGFFFWR